MVFEAGRSQNVPNGKKTTAGSLSEAIASFAANPVSAIGAIRQLQASDPSGLALAAARLLLSTEEKSPGVQYLTGLATDGTLLTDLFLSPRILALAAALTLARKLTSVEPQLDIRLLRSAATTAGGNLRSTETGLALRVLNVVDAISDCSRLSSYLVQFAQHPNAKVRSKGALLLGRSNWNPGRVESLLASDDGRLRANAVESLWGCRQKEATKILWKATQDPCGRVIVNALLGLCLADDQEAYSRLRMLAGSTDPVLRSGAAWAMGETGNPEVDDALAKLEQDANARVKEIAQNSRRKLRSVPVVSPASPDKPLHSDVDAETPATPAPNRSVCVRIG